MKTEQEFNLSEKIKELDAKVMNNEISLLVFLKLRNDLDKGFIKRDNYLIYLLITKDIDFREFMIRRNKLIGEK